jgi:hypothetical protein
LCGVLIERVGAFTDRFFLIEPAGNWYGAWRQEANLDWVAESIFLMRDRLQLQLEEESAPGGAETPAAAIAGEPVERRYPLDEFERLFDGYRLDVRGTIAGIEKYGSRPDAISPLRRDIGELTYRLLFDIEDTLVRHDLDLSAKHWVLSAQKGSGGAVRRQRRHLGGQTVAPTLAGLYDAVYTLESAPNSVTSGAEFAVVVSVANRS